MAQTLYQLYQLLFDSIPTILIFVALHFFLRRVLYRPLREALRERAARIEGRQQASRETLAAAETRLAAYWEARRQQQVENYHRIEARRQEALAAGQGLLNDARHQAAQALLEARQRLAADQAQVQRQLQTTSEALADQIISHVLGRRGAGSPGVGA